MNVSTAMRGAQPVDPVRRERLLRDRRQRRRAVLPAGEHVRQVEDPQRVERPEDQRDEDRRHEQRQRDPREALPRGGAVDLRRLVDLAGDHLQAREDQQRHERRRLPDVGEDDDDQRLWLGSEPDRVVPRTVFTKPYGDTNIVRHMIAVTTVSTAHGTSTTVRSRPWPLKASCIASAMPSPMTSSSATDATVKISVCSSAAHQRGRSSAFE